MVSIITVVAMMISLSVLIVVTLMLMLMLTVTNLTGDVYAIDSRVTVVINGVGTDFVFTGINQPIAIITVGWTAFTTTSIETVAITIGTAERYIAGLIVCKIHQAVTVVVDTVVADFPGAGVDVGIAVPTIPGPTATPVFRKAILILIRTAMRYWIRYRYQVWGWWYWGCCDWVGGAVLPGLLRLVLGLVQGAVLPGLLRLVLGLEQGAVLGLEQVPLPPVLDKPEYW